MSELPYDALLRPEKVAARDTLVHLRSRPVAPGIFEAPLKASLSLLAALMLDVSAEPGARVAGMFPVMLLIFLVFYFVALLGFRVQKRRDVLPGKGSR